MRDGLSLRPIKRTIVIFFGQNILLILSLVPNCKTRYEFNEAIVRIETSGIHYKDLRSDCQQTQLNCYVFISKRLKKKQWSRDIHFFV